MPTYLAHLQSSRCTFMAGVWKRAQNTRERIFVLVFLYYLLNGDHSYFIWLRHNFKFNNCVFYVRRLCVDHENVKPDILLLGKALAGGLYSVSSFPTFTSRHCCFAFLFGYENKFPQFVIK